MSAIRFTYCSSKQRKSCVSNSYFQKAKPGKSILNGFNTISRVNVLLLYDGECLPALVIQVFELQHIYAPCQVIFQRQGKLL